MRASFQSIAELIKVPYHWHCIKTIPNWELNKLLSDAIWSSDCKIMPISEARLASWFSLAACVHLVDIFPSQLTRSLPGSHRKKRQVSLREGHSAVKWRSRMGALSEQILTFGDPESGRVLAFLFCNWHPQNVIQLLGTRDAGCQAGRQVAFNALMTQSSWH